MPSHFARLTFACALAIAASGCVFLENFDDFKADPNFGKDSGVDAGEQIDAAPADPDAGADSSAPADPCEDVDCSDLDTECGVGECVKGKCTLRPIAAMDGEDCTADDKCTDNAVCDNGRCKGTPKDCTEFDSDCTQGFCDPSDGSCGYTNSNENDPCFDSDPCIVDESCQAGECVGVAKDCSDFDDACNVGTCDASNGACYDEPANEADACDDENDCTNSDRCNATGECIGDASANDVLCDDGDACTEKDHCDGAGTCVADAFADNTTACDDGNDCTSGELCNGSGTCANGLPDREGEPCWVGCETNDICEDGVCVFTEDSELVSTCQYFWCQPDDVCKDAYNGDGYCDCGCGFEDIDCNDCSAWMCLSTTKPKHEGRAWCDEDGKAVDNCPESYMNDGKCDCGCQFVDPDCEGGTCCDATGEAGCGNSFVEACVCNYIQFPRPECCDTEWTAECAQIAADYGCAVCP
jgi:hypothetical protein